MNKTMKKALSLALMIIMVLSSIPMTSLAVNVLCVAGHKWGTYTVTKAATCTTQGEKKATCERTGCDAVDTQAVAIDAQAHKPVNMPRVEATCDKYGNEAGVICGYCGITISGYTPIAPKNHKSTTLAAKPATCTEDGNKAGTKCETCGITLTGGEVIKKTDHKWELYSKVPATCTSKGSQIDICLNCGKKSEAKEIEASHSYGAWVTTPATCLVAGKMVRKCTVAGCNAEEVKPIDKLNHVLETVAAVAPTCDKAGSTAGKKCKVCLTNVEGVETVPAKGHTYITVAGKAATCTERGTSDSRYCSVCGFVEKEAVIIAALGHNMVADPANSKAATCTTTGVEAKKCSNTGCNVTETKVLPITHEANWVSLSQATCTTEGRKRGTCTKCGMDVTVTEPALGHTVNDPFSWKTEKYATCTEAGKRSANCSRCGTKVTETIPALGHKEAIKAPAVAPTCSKEGSTESIHCTTCGTVIVEAKKIDKLAHTYTWKVTTDPTCSQPGVKEGTCSVCSATTKEPVEKVAHTNVDIPAVAPTCTETGTTAGKKCSVCGSVTEPTAAVPALGHDYTVEVEFLDSTCTEPGYDKGKCSRCDSVKNEVIAAKGHTEEVIPGTAPTCEETGIKEGKKCITCNTIIAEQETLPALGHDLVLDAEKSKPATCTETGYAYSKCSRCDEIEETNLELLEHTWGQWTDKVAASCEAQGEQERICSVCNTVELQSTPSLGGHVVVTLPGQDATCTEPSKTAGSYCERCNTVFEEQVVGNPLGHQFGAMELVKKATTTEDGEFAYRCEICDALENPTKIAKIDEASIKLSTVKYYYNGKTRTPDVVIMDTAGTQLEKGTDFEVIYDTGRKNPGKYTAQVTLIGNYEGEVNLTFSINPVKTAKVSYENKGDHILITWDKVAGATGYTVYIYKDSENGTTRKALKTLTGTSYKLTKDYNGKALNLDENYRIGIVSRTKAEDGTILKSKNATIKTVTRKLVKPAINTLTSASGKVTAKWTNVANESGYEICYATSKDGKYTTAKTKIDVTTFTKSLTKNKTYYFKVRAYKVVDGETFYSNYSAIKSIKVK